MRLNPLLKQLEVYPQEALNRKKEEVRARGLELFDFGTGDPIEPTPTAVRQAPEHGNDLNAELLFLVSHGLLHLLGWDHPDEAALIAMLARQQALIGGGKS